MKNIKYEKLIKLHKAGMTLVQMAKNIGVSKPTIIKYLKEYGIEGKNPYKKIVRNERNKEKIYKAIEKYEFNNLNELSVKTRISVFACRRVLSEKLNGDRVKKLKTIEECIKINQALSGVKYIPLTHGKMAVVDAKTYDKIDTSGWFYNKKNGAICRRHQNNKTTVLMNRYVKAIVEDINGKVVTHKNLCVFDNTDGNLKSITRREAYSHNKRHGIQKSNSGFNLLISIKDKVRYLGIYDDEEDAMLVSDYTYSRIGVSREFLFYPEITDYSEYEHLLIKLRGVIENGKNKEVLSILFD